MKFVIKKTGGLIAGLFAAILALVGAFNKLARGRGESPSSHNGERKSTRQGVSEVSKVGGRSQRQSQANGRLAGLCSSGFWLIIVAHLLGAIGCGLLAWCKAEPLYLWELSANLLMIAVLVAFRFSKMRRRRPRHRR